MAMRNLGSRGLQLLENVTWIAPQRRLIANSFPLRCNKPVQSSTTTPVSSGTSGAAAAEPSLRSHYKPNNFERRCLVWTKKYKSLEEVPTLVSPEVMEYSRNKMRIKIANYMSIMTVIGCIIMVYSGKKAAERGEFVSKQNLDWHNQYNEAQAKKEAVK